jgi:hypothetical protein
MPPGLYFFRLNLTDPTEAAQDIRGLTDSGETRGPVYLAPIIIEPGASLSPDNHLGVMLGPFRVESFDTFEMPGALQVALVWKTEQEATRNYAIALRLYDSAGNEWATLDTQAGGGGMYPTGLWVPGRLIPDRYTLVLPPGIPPGDAYRLDLRLYDAVTLEVIGGASLQNVEVAQAWPFAGEHRLLGGEIALGGVSVEPEVVQGDPLLVVVTWTTTEFNALQPGAGGPPAQAYQVRWSLRDSDNTTIWQTVTPLSQGSDPRQWPVPTFVLGRHALDLPRTVPPGNYTLVMQLLAEDGVSIGDRVVAGQVRVVSRERLFEVPPLDTPLDITFGEQLKLWGYTVLREGDMLYLDVAWGALSDPAQDYTFFVHVFDPATEQIVAQIDSMPHAYSYPTSRWVAGEVVVDTLSLDLSDAPPGTYSVAVGWYDPNTWDRLAAVAGNGQSLPANRLVLDIDVVIP